MAWKRSAGPPPYFQNICCHVTYTIIKLQSNLLNPLNPLNPLNLLNLLNLLLEKRLSTESQRR